MLRKNLEVLSSGLIIDWTTTKKATNPSAITSRQRKIYVKCSQCNNWRWINSCALSQVRKGKQKFCWQCHKLNLAKKNSTGVIGRHINTNGYIVRTLASFTQDELAILRPMLRSHCKSRRKNHTEILEHRAIIALAQRRPLLSNEVVHHKNGIKNDNRIENLEVYTIGQHTIEHAKIIIENKAMKLEVEQLKKQLLDLESKYGK